MIQTRKLKKYDYYDCEEEVFVIWIGEQHTDDLKLDIKIKDGKKVYDCYLLESKYISKANEYKCKYKVYDL